MLAERLFVNYINYANYANYTNYTNFINYDIVSFVRASVHLVTKCTIMYCEQTAGPRRANFCTYMHVDKIASLAIFIQILNFLDL